MGFKYMNILCDLLNLNVKVLIKFKHNLVNSPLQIHHPILLLTEYTLDSQFSFPSSKAKIYYYN